MYLLTKPLSLLLGGSLAVILGLTATSLPITAAEPVSKYLNSPFTERFSPSTLTATLRQVAEAHRRLRPPQGGLLAAGLRAAGVILEDTGLIIEAESLPAENWEVRLAGDTKERSEAVGMVALMPKLEHLDAAKSWSDPQARVFCNYERRKLANAADGVVAGLVTYATAWGMSREIMNLSIDAFRLAVVEGWWSLARRVKPDGHLAGTSTPQETADLAGALLLAGSTALAESRRMATDKPLPFVTSERYQRDLTHQRQVLAQTPALERTALMASMRKATVWQHTSLWQVSGASDSPDADRSWYRGVFYAGMMPAYHTTGDSYYLGQVQMLVARTGAKPGPAALQAPDCLSISQTYLDLYDHSQDPALIAPTRAMLDAILAHPTLREPGGQYVDLVFTGASTWTRIGRIANDNRYDAYAKGMWTRCRARLHDPSTGLMFRDDTWLPQASGVRILERNGQPVFWGRCQGWAIAGLARLTEHLPVDDPMLPALHQDIRQLAEALLSCQGTDGMWRSSLLDPESYPMGESSATALIAYGLLWGVNHHVLDRARFAPPAERALRALTALQEPDGKLGYVQPGAESPRVPVYRSTNNEYATGAFLLAAVEWLQMAPTP